MQALGQQDGDRAVGKKIAGDRPSALKKALCRLYPSVPIAFRSPAETPWKPIAGNTGYASSMIAQGHSPRADPLLVEAWLRARSIARGIALPVPDHGGWRVESGTPTETRRYVFAQPAEGLSDLAEAIAMPNIALKLCGSEAELRSMVPPRWEVQPETSMMTRDRSPGGKPCPSSGYEVRLSTDGATTAARIVTSDGEVAASGFVAETGGVFVYDRIRTEPTHRRKGLGTALMRALASARRSSASIEILSATRDGQALYSTLGWTVYSPYTTALIAEGRA